MRTRSVGRSLSPDQPDLGSESKEREHDAPSLEALLRVCIGEGDAWAEVRDRTCASLSSELGIEHVLDLIATDPKAYIDVLDQCGLTPLAKRKMTNAIGVFGEHQRGPVDAKEIQHAAIFGCLLSATVETTQSPPVTLERASRIDPIRGRLLPPTSTQFGAGRPRGDLFGPPKTRRTALAEMAAGDVGDADDQVTPSITVVGEVVKFHSIPSLEEWDALSDEDQVTVVNHVAATASLKHKFATFDGDVLQWQAYRRDLQGDLIASGLILAALGFVVDYADQARLYRNLWEALKGGTARFIVDQVRTVDCRGQAAYEALVGFYSDPTMGQRVYRLEVAKLEGIVLEAGDPVPEFVNTFACTSANLAGYVKPVEIAQTLVYAVRDPAYHVYAVDFERAVAEARALRPDSAVQDAARVATARYFAEMMQAAQTLEYFAIKDGERGRTSARRAAETTGAGRDQGAAGKGEAGYHRQLIHRVLQAHKRDNPDDFATPCGYWVRAGKCGLHENGKCLFQHEESARGSGSTSRARRTAAEAAVDVASRGGPTMPPVSAESRAPLPSRQGSPFGPSAIATQGQLHAKYLEASRAAGLYGAPLPSGDPSAISWKTSCSRRARVAAAAAREAEGRAVARRAKVVGLPSEEDLLTAIGRHDALHRKEVRLDPDARWQQAVVDSGCGTSIVNRGFTMVRSVPREMTIGQSLGAEASVASTGGQAAGVTMARTGAGKAFPCIVVVNNAISMPEATESLLSSGQMSAAGGVMDLTSTTDGGRASLDLDGGTYLRLRMIDNVPVLEGGVRPLTFADVAGRKQPLPVYELTAGGFWAERSRTEPMTSSARRTGNATPAEETVTRVQRVLGIVPRETALATLATTRQDDPMSRRAVMRDHVRKRFPDGVNMLSEPWSTDALFPIPCGKKADAEAAQYRDEGYWLAQMFVGNESGMWYVVPLKRKNEAAKALSKLFTDIGVPPRIDLDNAGEQVHGEFESTCLDFGATLNAIEPGHSNQNGSAEGAIGKIRDKYYRLAGLHDAPHKYWRYGYQLAAFLHNRTAGGDGRTPLQRAGIETSPNIGCVGEYFEPVVYFESTATEVGAPHRKGFYLGPAKEGDEGCAYILDKESGKVRARGMWRPAYLDPLSRNEAAAAVTKEHFEGADPISLFNDADAFARASPEEVRRAHEKASVDNSVVNPVSSRPAATSSTPADEPQGTGPVDLRPVNQMRRDEYDRQLIAAELAKVSELEEAFEELVGLPVVGNWPGQGTFRGTVHEVDAARARHHGGKGDIFGVHFVDDDFHWVTLEQLLHMTAKGAKAPGGVSGRGLIGRLTKRAKRIKWTLVGSQSSQGTARRAATFVNGVQEPRNYAEAMAIDAAEGSTRWRDAVDARMATLIKHRVFRPLANGEGTDKYQYARLLPIYYVKPDGSRRMRIVIQGNSIDSSAYPAYSGVVRATTMRAVLAVAQHLHYSTRVVDIKSAYIHARNPQPTLTKASPEFGSPCGAAEFGEQAVGTLVAIDGALEGLATSGRQFNIYLAERLASIGFCRSWGDESAFLRREPSGLYSYILAYVDDMIVCAQDADGVVTEIETMFDLSHCDGSSFLGLDIAEGGASIGAASYLHRVIPELEAELGPFREADSPTATGDHPEEDDSPLLGPEDHKIFQRLLGTCTWVGSTTRPDVSFAICSIARFQCAPREGHLRRLRKILGYLKQHPDLGIPITGGVPAPDVLMQPAIGDDLHLYEKGEVDARADYPTPAPGTEMPMTVWVDADYAHDKVTCRSITGHLVYLGPTLIDWSAKRLPTVAGSSFASEFGGMKRATETIRALRYTLRSLGIQVTEPARLLGDNLSAIQSATLEKTTLKARHELVAFHTVREAVATGVLTCNHVASEENRADLLTKGFSRFQHARLADLIMVPVARVTTDVTP